jgi:hypothetical protein
MIKKLKIFADSLVSSMVLIIAVIIFEIVFFFVKIKKDIEGHALNMIDKVPITYIDIIGQLNKNPIFNNLPNEQKSKIEVTLKTIFSQSIKDLVNLNKQILNQKRKKSLIVLYVSLFIYIIITLIFGFLLRNHIDFIKLFAFVSLTLVITAIFEIIFYFTIFSKIKTTNEEKLLIKLHSEFINYLKEK